MKRRLTKVEGEWTYETKCWNVKETLTETLMELEEQEHNIGMLRFGTVFLSLVQCNDWGKEKGREVLFCLNNNDYYKRGRGREKKSEKNGRQRIENK